MDNFQKHSGKFMKCINCIYWEKYRDYQGRGRCRRYPLIFLGIDPSGGDAIYNCPDTNEQDWCGEFKVNK